MGCVHCGAGRIDLAYRRGWEPTLAPDFTSVADRRAALVSGWKADCLLWRERGRPEPDLRGALRWRRPQAGNQRREWEGGRRRPDVVAGRSVAGFRLGWFWYGDGARQRIYSCSRFENGPGFRVAGFGRRLVSPVVA